MNFFEHQDQATANSKKLILLFLLAIIGIVAAVYFPVQWFMYGYIWKYKLHQTDISKDNEIIWNYSLFLKISLGTLLIIGIASWTKIRELASGGPIVAKMMGGRLVEPETRDLKEKQLLNVVEEMSIAAGIPVPNVYLLDREFTINAFAAGYTTGDAVIGVTRGTIDKLNRDELQGVIAHEFSHILHGDMRLNIKLMGLLYGILVISLIGRALVTPSRFRTSSRNNGGALVLGGLGLMVIGSVGYFFGRLIQAAVARQREFLADASAVQYTRNPDGIGDALKVIAGYGKVPAAGTYLLTHNRGEISHMTFGSVNYMDGFEWMSSHPPIEKRIKMIDPHFRPDQYERKPPLPYPVTQSSVSAPEPQRKVRVGDFNLPSSEKLQYGYASMLNSVGTLPANAVAAQSQWLSSMDETVEQACRNTQKARAVMYVLVGEYSEASKLLFTKYFEIRFPDIVPDFHDLWEPIKNLGPENRLKLVDLCIPALRKLSKDEYKQFVQTLLELIDLDNNVTMFEFLLAKIIQRHLQHFFHPTKTTKISIYDVYSVEKEITFLISTLACQGTAEKVQAQKALESGLKEILPKTFFEIQKSSQDYKEIDATLKSLRRTTFQIRREILNACAKTVMFDQEVTWKEVELLRAIADTLDCPLPPLNT